MMNLTDATFIHLDKETFSEVDLTKVGVYKYADHPSTDVLLASYAVNGGPVRRWRPGDPYPLGHIHDRLGDDAFILAWNSNFERIMWWRVMCERYGWPKPPLEAFICVAAWARSAASSPSKLELAGRFFGQTGQKDMRGHAHMLKMCKPATESQQLKYLEKIGFDPRYDHGPDVMEEAKRCHHTPENIDLLHDYCDADTETERDIERILPEWEWPEVEAFWESERINDHGAVVDLDFAAAAADYADDEKIELKAELIRITGDPGMTPRTFDRFKKWALPKMSDDAIELCEWYDKGVLKISFDADVRSNLLAAAETDPDFLDPDVWDAVEVLDEAGKSTISKYIAIRDRATSWLTDDQPRVHGLYMFGGAAQSGRYSSVGLQAHNLVRDVPSEAPQLIDAFISGDRRLVKQRVDEWAEANERQPSIIHALGQLVRPTITGDIYGEGDFDLVWGDWSSVEAIMLPWLALDPGADETLAVFRRGEDIYLKTASDILGRRITKDDKHERQAYGKVPTLSLGYGGGAGAFQSMAKNYGVRMDEAEIGRIVRDWRKANSWAGRFWDALDNAAYQAMDNPGPSFGAGRVAYRYDPDALDGMGALFCVLPSGREICYPDPAIEVVRKPWGLTKTITCRKGSWRPKKDAKDWPRVALWKGLKAENATQAACADLLNSALLRARENLLTVCAHTHDEIVIETADPEGDAPLLKKIMESRPGWPGDDALPLKADVETGFRYKVPLPEAA